MRFILAGNRSAADLVRGQTYTGFVVTDSGLPFDLAAFGGFKYLVFSGTASTSVGITLHPSRGQYGEFSFTVPLTLASGTYTASLVLDSGTGTSGQVIAVARSSNGSGYKSAPTVTISDVSGSGAAAVVGLTPTTVASVSVVAGGSGFQSVPTIQFTGSSTSSAAATATLKGSISSVYAVDVGKYTSVPELSISGGTGAVITPVLQHEIAAVKMTNMGSGYTSVPLVLVTGGGGVGLECTAVIDSGRVIGVTISSPGYGYTTPPTLSFSGGGGTGAAADAFISTGYMRCALLSSSASFSTARHAFPGAVLAQCVCPGSTLAHTLDLTFIDDVLVSVSQVSASGSDGSYSLTLSVNGVGVQVDWTRTGGVSGPYTIVDSTAWVMPSLTLTGTPAGGTVSTYKPRFYRVQIASGLHAGSSYISSSSSHTVLIGLSPDTIGSYNSYGQLVNANNGENTVSYLNPSLSACYMVGATVSAAGSGYSANYGSVTGSTLTVNASTLVSGTYNVVTDNYVSSVSVTSGGAGYTEAPSVTFSGGSPTVNATGTAALTGTTIASITVTTPGSNYTKGVTASLSGGAPSAAPTLTVSTGDGTITPVGNTLSVDIT